jgi:hypothetical protein
LVDSFELHEGHHCNPANPHQKNDNESGFDEAFLTGRAVGRTLSTLGLDFAGGGAIFSGLKVAADGAASIADVAAGDGWACAIESAFSEDAFSAFSLSTRSVTNFLKTLSVFPDNF